MILSQVLVVTNYVSVMFSLDKMNLYADYEGPDEGMFCSNILLFSCVLSDLLAILNKI
jgi:hypothetical protein